MIFSVLMFKVKFLRRVKHGQMPPIPQEFASDVVFVVGVGMVGAFTENTVVGTAVHNVTVVGDVVFIMGSTVTATTICEFVVDSAIVAGNVIVAGVVMLLLQCIKIMSCMYIMSLYWQR